MLLFFIKSFRLYISKLTSYYFQYIIILIRHYLRHYSLPKISEYIHIPIRLQVIILNHYYFSKTLFTTLFFA